MKLLGYVPVFVFLVTIVSLISPAYADANQPTSKSNTSNIWLSQSGVVQGTISGTATIMYTADGQPANSKPDVFTFSFTRSQIGKAFARGLHIMKTDVPANGATVTLDFDASANGPAIQIIKQVRTQANTPVTVDFNRNNGAVVIVEITTQILEN